MSVSRFRGQRYEAERARCLASHEMFIDQQFRPVPKSVMFSSIADGIEWLRPRELCAAPRSARPARAHAARPAAGHRVRVRAAQPVVRERLRVAHAPPAPLLARRPEHRCARALIIPIPDGPPSGIQPLIVCSGSGVQRKRRQVVCGHLSFSLLQVRPVDRSDH